MSVRHSNCGGERGSRICADSASLRNYLIPPLLSPRYAVDSGTFPPFVFFHEATNLPRIKFVYLTLSTGRRERRVQTKTFPSLSNRVVSSLFQILIPPAPGNFRREKLEGKYVQNRINCFNDECIWSSVSIRR